ncbi:MAG: serine/threonine protein kinase [Planctomycetota bacterium]|nr:MAG: serine/threonine protein kinase [Planctomycetota bacterium]
MMDEARRRLIERLFHAAADLPLRERDAFLAARCGDDRELRREIESLLAYDHAETQALTPDSAIDADQLLRQFAPVDADATTDDCAPATTRDESRPTGALPERIGAYRILGVLGEGGMGVVYRAEQDSPRRSVALKVIRPEFMTPKALRRFEFEASVLGRLQHAGIAQIYEAGAAEFPGLPGRRTFFAMELVDGRPLIDYALLKRLSIRERLALFANVCDAVEHAHRNGVIHRDLKSGNILVTEDGRPKVLDFGVARVVDSDARMTTLQTDVGQIIGTVPYMSPEQVSGDPHAIDTRSDVYALGVNLYELLTGRLPHDLARASLIEAVRIIRDEPPTQIRRVNKALRGDIETILDKALQKDKAQRYQSAADLAADIRRYLRDEPILARPPSAMYQLRKFARRNKSLVGGAAAVFVVLVAGVTVSTSQYIKAERARRAETAARTAAEQRRAEAEAARRKEAEQRQIAEASLLRAQREAQKNDEINRFLRDMLSAVNPNIARGRELTVRDVLDAAARRIARRGAQLDPEVRAAIQTTIGLTYLRLGLLDRADPHLTAALETRRKVFDGVHVEVAEALNNLAELRRAQGRLEEAADLTGSAIPILRALYGDSEPAARALHNLAAVEADLDRLDEAERRYREALAIRRTARLENRASLASTVKALGNLLGERGRFDEAERLLREALALRRAVLPADHPEIATALSDLGYTLARAGKLDQAEPLLSEALAIQRRVLPATHPALASTLAIIGASRLAAGAADAAEEPLRESLKIRTASLPADHWLLLNTRSLLGECLTAQGRLEEARSLVVDAADALLDHPDAPRQRRAEAAARAVRFFEAAGDAGSADAWRRTVRELDEIREKQGALPPGD